MAPRTSATAPSKTAISDEAIPYLRLQDPGESTGRERLIVASVVPVTKKKNKRNTLHVTSNRKGTRCNVSLHNLKSKAFPLPVTEKSNVRYFLVTHSVALIYKAN